MSEPPTKKVRLELSPSSEPLTQKDVIFFQKEALFRCLNQHRSDAEVARVQLAELQVLLQRCHERLGKVCGVVRCVARLVVEAGDKKSSMKIDKDMQELCEAVLEEGDDAVLEKASEFSTALFHWLHEGARLSVSEGTTSLEPRWHELEALNCKLEAENEQLRSEVFTVKSYYQSLLGRYDRAESMTVKRVFKIEDDGTQVSDTNNNHNIITSKDKDFSGDGSVELSADTFSSETLLVASNGTQQQKDQGTTQNIMPKDISQKEQQQQLRQASVDPIQQVEYELQVADFQAQIKVLEESLSQFREWREKNEKELVTLRQEYSAVTKSNIAQASGARSKNADSFVDNQMLMSKIEKLTEENKELAQVNEAYLAKFHQLTSDREVFTSKLSTEFQSAQETLKKHNSNLEKDLVRIRTARDELLSKIAVLEAQKSKSEMLEDLERVLEIQQQQLTKLNEKKLMTPDSKDPLVKELQDLEQAFKELSQYSNKKYSKYINQDSIMSKLTVEKTKADQKYFAAMRSKDSILIENKNLSKNLNKSNELIQQLKDIEKTLQMKTENLTKQLQISQTNEKRLIDSNKITSLKVMDLTSQLNKIKKANTSLQQEYSKSIEEKSKLESRLLDLQVEVKALSTNLQYQENKSKKLHRTLISNGGDNGALAEELENFRTVVYCSLCSKNWKNTTIKTCGHVFCADCCKERLAARMRKCPTCNKAFSSNDLLVIHL